MSLSSSALYTSFSFLSLPFNSALSITIVLASLLRSSNCSFIFLALTMLAAVSIPFVGISTLLPTFARCSFSLRSSSMVCFCFISMFSARIFLLFACRSIKSESLSILSCCASSVSMTALLLAVRSAS